MILFAPGRAHISRIGKYVSLLTMQEGMGLGHIMFMRWGCYHRMDESRFGNYANVRLYPEMPLPFLV